MAFVMLINMIIIDVSFTLLSQDDPQLTSAYRRLMCVMSSIVVLLLYCHARTLGQLFPKPTLITGCHFSWKQNSILGFPCALTQK